MSRFVAPVPIKIHMGQLARCWDDDAGDDPREWARRLHRRHGYIAQWKKRRSEVIPFECGL